MFMALSCWSYLLGILMAVCGAACLAAPAAVSKAFNAFPRSVWTGRILSLVAWAWSAYAVMQMGLDFLEPYKKFVPVIALVCVPLTWVILDNLLSCRAWGGILCLFPYELLHAARVHDSPWRLALVIFAYLCIVKGMVLLLYPWKQRQLIVWTTANASRFRAFGVLNLAVGIFFIALGATALK